jgi:undecaprenyl-phosphate galactose phosphotransferase
VWQVSGRSGTTFKDRALMDMWYVRNWSLWVDIVILIKTIRVVLRRTGAY